MPSPLLPGTFAPHEKTAGAGRTPTDADRNILEKNTQDTLNVSLFCSDLDRAAVCECKGPCIFCTRPGCPRSCAVASLTKKKESLAHQREEEKKGQNGASRCAQGAGSQGAELVPFLFGRRWLFRQFILFCWQKFIFCLQSPASCALFCASLFVALPCPFVPSIDDAIQLRARS